MSETVLEIYENPALQSWAIDAADFPAGGTMSEVISFCIGYAVLAPSSHNSQPWWFDVDGNHVTIGLDPSRGLAVVDPDDREATISVGAAVFTLRAALGHFGFASTVAYWPDPNDPEACVQLEVTDVGTSDPNWEPFFDAITRRHTSRSRFLDQTLPQAVLDALVADARAENTDLTLLLDYPSRRALAELVSDADRQQMSDRRFRRELASWLRSAHTRRGDGIRGYGSSLQEVMSVAEPLIVRTFDIGEGRAARDVELATGSPVIAVLSTHADDRTAWLQTGQALARIALRATAANILLGYLDQPVEVPNLRADVAALAGIDGHPQLVLRLGYGVPAVPQPRRALDDAFGRH